MNDPNANALYTGYTGMTVDELRTTYDRAIPATDFVNNSGDAEAAGVTVAAPLNAGHYCVYSVVGNWFAWKRNPDGVIKQDTDASRVCT